MNKLSCHFEQSEAFPNNLKLITNNNIECHAEFISASRVIPNLMPYPSVLRKCVAGGGNAQGVIGFHLFEIATSFLSSQ